MSLHEVKYCPKCSKPFECKPGNITQCQCFEVELSCEESQFIVQQFSDCLCKLCLIELKKEYSKKEHKAKIKALENLIINLKDR